mgnify:CR=1 FL=1
MSFFERLATSLGLDDFDNRHKIGLAFLFVALISITSLWIIQLRRNISGPLYGPITGANSVLPNTNTQEQGNDAVLKTKDTDGDGLTDWDELNLYKTSPYLNDTDSDGFSDKAEIDSANDPNCPKGQECADLSSQSSGDADPFQNSALLNDLNASASASSGTQSPATVSPTSAPATGGLTEEEKNALRQLVGNSNDPSVLRQLLIQAGQPADQVNKISDAELQATLQSLLK